MITIENGINNCTIININTNFNKNKLLELLDIYSKYKKISLIVTNVTDLLLYKRINQNISFNKIIHLGASSESHVTSAIYYNDIESFIKNGLELFTNEVILIVNDINRYISDCLQELLHETKLIVNLNTIEYNINYFRSKINSHTKIMAMVKASGYGLDNNCEIPTLLQTINVDYLGVTYIDEGIHIRKRGINIPIMLLVTNPKYIDNIIKYNIEPTIYNFYVLNKIIESTKHIPKYFIHIKIDTGMHRLGFLPEEIYKLVGILKKNPNIIVKSIFSHLAASDETSKNSESFSKNQINTLITIANNIEVILGYKIIKHIANTESVTKYPNSHLDMIRIGKGLYGLYSYNDLTKAVATLKTKIVQIKNIHKGETIGYNRKTILKKDTKIAIIKIGYADGYNYDITQQAYVLINNQKAYILGKVCMDLCMVDITHITCKQEDAVILFDDKNLFVEQIAKWKNTSAYEVITAISKRVKRIYIYK